MNEMNTSEVRKILDEVPGESLVATSDLMNSLSAHKSRRWLLRGAAAGATGLAVTGITAALTATNAMHAQAVHAEAAFGGGDLSEFFNILATGEELFATFYRLGIAHHQQLGINGDALIALEAIRVEEEPSRCPHLPEPRTLPGDAAAGRGVDQWSPSGLDQRHGENGIAAPGTDRRTAHAGRGRTPCGGPSHLGCGSLG